MNNLNNKIFLTGIKPTGRMHIGNYMSAIKPIIELSQNHKSFVFIADLHALNSVFDPILIKEYTEKLVATIISLGLNLNNAILFKQSDILEVTYLSQILMNVTPKGLLNRAHAYKNLTEKNINNGQDLDNGINMGLYTYPVLMAADILLYDADYIPVGFDQTQHIEFTRDIAGYFNKIYDNIFKMPQAFKEDLVISGIDGRKMSKSYNNTLPLFEENDKELYKQIMKIKTDSKTKEEPKNPEESIIFNIYKIFATDEEITLFKNRFLNGGLGYGEAKQVLFSKIQEYFKEYRVKYDFLMNNKNEIYKVLKDGATKAQAVAINTINKVKKAVFNI